MFLTVYLFHDFSIETALSEAECERNVLPEHVILLRPFLSESMPLFHRASALLVSAIAYAIRCIRAVTFKPTLKL